MKLAIGSMNPAKVNAVKNVVSNEIENIEVVSIDAPSGVSSQPFSDKETIDGAVNRAEFARKAAAADIGIGLEGGVVETENGLFLCNWGALSFGKEMPIVAGGARILLPNEIAEKLRAGLELGPVMDQFCQRKDVGKGNGAVGIFTGGLVKRDEMFEHILKLLVGQYLYHLKS
ncbi:DUF84 family protein [Falsibacillus pallidus]|uniref:DUF84 family protein n=1 Tax=Falsibacillus pallidus TaxID=493781 RepID=UPI003D98E22C